MKHLKILATLILSLALMIGVNGCSNSGNNSEKKTESYTKVVTDLAGRKVAVPVEAKKIVTTAPGHGGAFMTMCAILGKDVENYIVGWDGALKENNQDMYNHYAKTLPKLKEMPDVGRAFKEKFNVEKVISLKPDLCIFSLEEKGIIDASAAQQLDKAKIPYVYIQLVDEKTENQEKSARLIGEVLNQQEKADKIIKISIGKRREIEKRIAKISEKVQKKPTVYFECTSRGVDEYGWTYSNKVQWGLMTMLAGGENISDKKYEKYGKMDIETLLRANPEHIFLTGGYYPKSPTALKMGFITTQDEVKKQLEQFKGRKGWDQLQAVKNGKVHALYHSMGCELFDFVALEFIAKEIYPQEFSDIDPEKDLQEYFDTFLPFKLEGVWLCQ